jgi:chromosome segregation ATPase
MKEETKKLREEIAALEKKQIEMKAQRKTVNLKVKRTVDPYSAAMNVLSNREKLRVMYAAYGLMRGKRFNQVENHWDTKNNDIHPLYGLASQINNVLNKYGYTMEYTKVKTWYGEKQEFKENCDEKIVRIGEQEA